MPGKKSPSVLEDLEPRSPAPARVTRVFGELRFHTDRELLALAFASVDTLWSIEEPGLLLRWNALTGQQLRVTFLSDVEAAWQLSSGARWRAAASAALS